MGKITRVAFYLILLAVCVVSLNSYNGSRSLKQLLLIENSTDLEAGKACFFDAYFINRLTKDGAVIGVYMAGVAPYFTQRRYIDFLGKNDSHIAKLPMQLPPKDGSFFEKIRFFYPGHLKTDYKYAILEKKPDMFFTTQKRSSKIVEAAGDKYMMFSNGMFLLKNSKNIKWDALEKVKAESNGMLKEVFQ